MVQREGERPCPQAAAMPTAKLPTLGQWEEPPNSLVDTMQLPGLEEREVVSR